jgi:hypothetical protein
MKMILSLDVEMSYCMFHLQITLTRYDKGLGDKWGQGLEEDWFPEKSFWMICVMIMLINAGRTSVQPWR